MANFSSLSRYLHTETITFDGEETVGTWVRPSWMKKRPPDNMIKTFRVTTQNEGRPDLIAENIYGSPLLDWVLIAFNNAATLNWPEAGTIIEYPSDQVVMPEVI